MIGFIVGIILSYSMLFRLVHLFLFGSGSAKLIAYRGDVSRGSLSEHPLYGKIIQFPPKLELV